MNRTYRAVMSALVIGALTPIAFAGAGAASARTTSDPCASSVTVHAPADGRTAVTPGDVGLPAQAVALTAAASKVHAHWLTSIHCHLLPRTNKLNPGATPRRATHAPSMAATDYTYNWSGYYVTTSQTPASVSGGWTEPTVSLPTGSSEAHSAVWVGMGGMGGSGELIQDGTGQDMYTDGSVHFFWYELYPIENAVALDPATFPIKAGDKVSATSSWANGTASFGLCNVTTAQCASFSQASPAPDNSAEWIVEAPGINGAQATLAAFTPVTFSGGSYQAPSAQTPAQGGATGINMVDQSNRTTAVAGALSGGAFTDYYQGPGATLSRPSVPRSVHVTNGSSGGALTVVASWTRPAVASPAVTSYQVKIQGRSPQGVYTGYRYVNVYGSAALNIAGARGYLYRVQVVARNGVGFGSWSPWSNFAYPR